MFGLKSFFPDFSIVSYFLLDQRFGVLITASFQASCFRIEISLTDLKIHHYKFRLVNKFICKLLMLIG